MAWYLSTGIFSTLYFSSPTSNVFRCFVLPSDTGMTLHGLRSKCNLHICCWFHTELYICQDEERSD
jgi:hypothetical protein